MRGSTVLFLAGAAATLIGTAGPVLAADEPEPVAPAPAAESSSAVTPGEEPAPAPPAADDPEPQPEPEPADDGGGLERPSLDSVIDERDEGRREARADARGRDEAKRPLANASVTMKDIEFRPTTLSISPGDRVTWVNRDTAQHNAVDDGEFRTPLLEKGERASVTIDDPGTYDYVCTVHPDMKATLVAGSAGSRGSGGSGGSGGTGSSGGTSPSAGSSSSGSFPSPSSGSGSSGGSGGSLPNTGQEQLPLLVLGAGLIAAGLLARAFHEYWIWR